MRRTQLAPAAGVAATQPGVTAGELAHRALARALRPKAAEFADLLVAEILATDHSYGEAAIPHLDLWRSCHDNFCANLEALAGRPLTGDLLEAARATGRRRAEQGLPLEHVLHWFRMGGRLLWEALVEEGRRCDSSTDELLAGAAEVWALTDKLSTAVAESYRGAEAALLRRHEQRRQALMDGLIEGRGREHALVLDAAAALDLPERGRYTVVVAEVLRGREALRRPGEALAVAGIRSAWRLRADVEVGIVSLGAHEPDELVEALTPHVGGRAGLGQVVNGLGSVDAAYRLAVIAMQTVPAGEATLASITDRLPEALVVAAPDLAQLVATATLGPVLRLEPSDRGTLIETLQGVLDASGSAARAADRLGCHRNTVLNRLRRLEVLTGRSLGDPGDAVLLGLAMAAVRVGGLPA